MHQINDLLQGHLQVTPFVQVTDDDRPDVLGGWVDSGHPELPQQVFLECLPAGHRVLQGRVILFLAYHLGTRHVVTRVGAQIILPLGDAVGHQRFPSRLGLPDRVRTAVVFIASLFQRRVLLQLLRDSFLQIEMGQLEELDGLLQLGRHHQLRHEFLGELDFECHRGVLPRQVRCYSLNPSPR